MIIDTAKEMIAFQDRANKILALAQALADEAPDNQALWFLDYCASADLKPTLALFTITRSLAMHILRTRANGALMTPNKDTK